MDRREVINKKIAESRLKSLSPDERKSIAKKGGDTNWDKKRGIQGAQYNGVLKIGDLNFPCSVLSDETRILTQTDFMNGMGIHYSGWMYNKIKEESKNAAVYGSSAVSSKFFTEMVESVGKNNGVNLLSHSSAVENDNSENLPNFMRVNEIQKFIKNHFKDGEEIIVPFRTSTGHLSKGIKAAVIPKICKVWMDAAKEGNLSMSQKRIAEKAETVLMGLATVGITALIDEATGFQNVREKNALSKILETYISRELMQWVKTFPDEFYNQICRLRKISAPIDNHRWPSYFGNLTNDVVYERLAPHVLDELRKTVPRRENGALTASFHRKLTPMYGHPRLREHLSSVIALMKISKNWEEFKRHLDDVFPRFGSKRNNEGQLFQYN